jgi:hypothetical protein
VGLVEVNEIEASADREAHARSWCERLEAGDILFFGRTPFPLPEADRAFLLNVRQASAAYHKNVSYRPGQDRVKGFDRGAADAEALQRILRAFSRRVTDFVAGLLPPYARRWQLDFASFRPLEEEGRRISLRARNDLLHVDSFPSRPTNGSRILRVFTNINPTKSRTWITTEAFDVLAPRLAMSMGLGRVAARARSPWAGLRRLPARLGRTLGLPLVDRAPYDEFMLGFHHAMKGDQAFQATCPKSRWEFPPDSTWLLFTDMVPHAALSGQFALEQTFIVPCDALVRPDKAPIRILEALCGVPLAH